MTLIEGFYQAVKSFHYRMGISARQEMSTDTEEQFKGANEAMRYVLATMKSASQLIETQGMLGVADARWLRAHLILEECAEMLDAMFSGDKVEALDGAADLIYVVVGTAVQFGWPLEEACAEVHRSNMTKQPLQGPRLRLKGLYSPADIAKVLEIDDAKYASTTYASTVDASAALSLTCRCGTVFTLNSKSKSRSSYPCPACGDVCHISRDVKLCGSKPNDCT